MFELFFLIFATSFVLSLSHSIFHASIFHFLLINLSWKIHFSNILLCTYVRFWKKRWFSRRKFNVWLALYSAACCRPLCILIPLGTTSVSDWLHVTSITGSFVCMKLSRLVNRQAMTTRDLSCTYNYNSR